MSFVEFSKGGRFDMAVTGMQVPYIPKPIESPAQEKPDADPIFNFN